MQTQGQQQLLSHLDTQTKHSTSSVARTNAQSDLSRSCESSHSCVRQACAGRCCVSNSASKLENAPAERRCNAASVVMVVHALRAASACCVCSRSSCAPWSAPGIECIQSNASLLLSKLKLGRAERHALAPNCTYGLCCKLDSTLLSQLKFLVPLTCFSEQASRT